MAPSLPINEMDRVADEFDGGVGFYVKDLATGTLHECNADRRFPTASICKIPVMIELFRQAEEGGLSLLDRRRLKQPISAAGTGVLRTMEDEPELTLRDYCRLMIQVSDNMATDLLVDLVGQDRVNATMEALGASNTRTSMTLGKWHYLMKGLADLEPSRANDHILMAADVVRDSISYSDSLENNVASARDMGTILERIYYGQIVSRMASHEMLEMLKGCDSRTKIPRDLKPDVVVAHKIGGSNRIQGDVGIALLPSGPLVISILTLANEGGGAQGMDLIAGISRMAVEAFSLGSVESL